MRRTNVILGAICLCLSVRAAEPGEGVTLDPALPEYVKGESLTGEIRAVGSSSVANLLSRWSEEFATLHPGVKIQVTGGGSGTAMPALLAGSCDLAPMSRPLSEQEAAAFREKFGHAPTQLRVAMDALAVFVNKDNPVKGLTLSEVDALFSGARKRGHAPVETWRDLGVDAPWADKPIERFGLRDIAGGHAFLRERALMGGEFRSDVRAEPGSSAIVNGVGAEPASVGYASQFFRTRRTRAAAIAVTEAGPYVEPTYEACVSGRYPLSRFFYLVVNKKPGAPLDPKVAEFLKYVFSKSGQGVVLRDGNFPINAPIANQELEALRP